MAQLTRLSLGIFLTLAILFSACNSYQKVLRGNDTELKYQTAKKNFEEGEYGKALPLLEDLITYVRGTMRGEEVSYWLAYTYYKTGQNQLAAFHFANFASTYPLSPKAEEATYLRAYNLYLSSPREDLDQETTSDAINAFLIFASRYPNSPKVSEANDYIDKLTLKLEEKAIDNAFLYYNIEDYKAALWALQNVIQQYPATLKKELIQFYMLKSAYKMAENSVETKKEERYSLALQYYQEFKEAFPASTYAAEADNLVQDINRALKKIKTEQL
jgi:outer membrane protein assembly factor BamD